MCISTPFCNKMLHGFVRSACLLADFRVSVVELMRSEREEIGQMQEYFGHILVEMIMFTVMAMKIC